MQKGWIMTPEEARRTIRNFLNGTSNIIQYMEALEVAESVLGEDCTLVDIDRWAHDRE